ncbi:uncharacterized protein LOC132700284 [Cylas formicarius]|uniref:uncharacterized protein LOC132700284 n=1 Tax=Cylas formicarius TaxID=197179 RepID=UPI002958846D|nr:uncharacterized protein LOC132700284 [Cylas formicarius]
MFAKLAVLTCCLAAVAAVYNGPLAGGRPADLYPAGVSPQACPNFPHCSNPAVSADPNTPLNNNWGSPQPQWGQQQQWNGGQQWAQNNWNQAPAVPQAGNWDPASQTPLDRGEYVGDGDYHGEGLYEALAPGYENRGGGGWNQGNQGQWNQGGWAHQLPAGVGQPAQLPAGVTNCPNYPICH